MAVTDDATTDDVSTDDQHDLIAHGVDKTAGPDPGFGDDGLDELKHALLEKAIEKAEEADQYGRDIDLSEENIRDVDIRFSSMDAPKLRVWCKDQSMGICDSVTVFVRSRTYDAIVDIREF